MRRLGGVLAGGMLVAGSLVVVGVAPAGADSFSVATEAQYRAALSAASSGPRTIEITADFTITGATDPTYAGSEPLTINGNGHTLDGNDTRRILDSTSTERLTIDDLTLTKGFSGSGGGAIHADGAVTVTNSTFTENRGNDGGAIFADGAVTVTNSTFTDNRSTGQNGFGGAIFAQGAVAVTYSTFTGNDNLGGNNGTAILSFTSITLFGSVLVRPNAGWGLCAGATTSLGYNYANEDAPGSCNLTAMGDNASNGNDPLLGPLAGNGGPTPTRLPQSGSPLINAIPNAVCLSTPIALIFIAADQRGFARPEQTGGKCDIGAAEVQLPAAVPIETAIRFTG